MRTGRFPEPTARNGALGLVALAAAAVVAVSLIGALGGSFWVFDLLSHYRLQYAGLLLIAVIAASAMRSVVVAAPIAVMLAIHLVPLAPLVLGAEQPTGEGQSLRVVQFNVKIGNAETDAGAAWLREQRADLIVIQEADQRWADALDEGLAGMYRLDPGFSTVRNDSFGMILYAADDLDVIDVRSIDVGGNPPVPAYVVELAGAGQAQAEVRIVALHTFPPISAAYVGGADEQLAWAARTLNAHPGPRVLIGDLNATRWSAPYRSLVGETSLRDSADGFGLRGTWPSTLAFTGMIGIDHVLVSDEIRVDDRRVGPGLGSDHRPVVADLTIVAG